MRTLALAALLVILTACGASAPVTDSTGAIGTAASPSAAATPASSAPSAAPSAEPSTATSPAPSAQSGGTNGTTLGNIGEFEQRISGFLATQINQPADTLQLQSKEETEWSDGSLGCPDPATMYIQVITPGYKLTYSDGSQTYEVHTNQDGTQAVWCNNGQPTTINQP